MKKGIKIYKEKEKYGVESIKELTLTLAEENVVKHGTSIINPTTNPIIQYNSYIAKNG